MVAFQRAAIVCCLLSGSHMLAQQSPGTWRTGDAPATLRGPISRADLIVVSLQSTLLAELTDALDRGGPAFATRSRHIDVLGAFRRLELRDGIRAGFTSDRLRDPANAPPPWAAPLVRADAGRHAREVDGYAVDLGPTVGVLRPIAERPMCGSCHGPAAKISSEVREAIARGYPHDRAMGFGTDEIRGWFWVEIPKVEIPKKPH